MRQYLGAMLNPKASARFAERRSCIVVAGKACGGGCGSNEWSRRLGWSAWLDGACVAVGYYRGIYVIDPVCCRPTSRLLLQPTRDRITTCSSHVAFRRAAWNPASVRMNCDLAGSRVYDEGSPSPYVRVRWLNRRRRRW